MRSQLATLKEAVREQTITLERERRAERNTIPETHTRVIAIASGKGGVGKTTFAVNLAATLATFKKTLRILLLDADWGMANAHIYLNETPQYTAAAVLTGHKPFSEIIHRTRYGFDLISGGNGLEQLFSLTSEHQALFHQELLSLEQNTEYDFLIIDCGAGASEPVQQFLKTADEAIIVTQSEPAALTDAYSLIKGFTRNLSSSSASLEESMKEARKEASEREDISLQTSLDAPLEVPRESPIDSLNLLEPVDSAQALQVAPNISLIINRCDHLDYGVKAGMKVIHSAQKYLNQDVNLLGTIQDENTLKKTAYQGGVYALEHPHSYMAISLRKIALTLLEWGSSANRTDSRTANSHEYSRVGADPRTPATTSILRHPEAYATPRGKGLRRFFTQLLQFPSKQNPQF